MSKIYNLDKDTKIVEKSVVSKRLFQNKNASVDIYAFDEGEELDHEMLFIDSLAFVIDGEAQLEYGEKQMKLGPALSRQKPGESSNLQRRQNIY